MLRPVAAALLVHVLLQPGRLLVALVHAGPALLCFLPPQYLGLVPVPLLLQYLFKERDLRVVVDMKP